MKNKILYLIKTDLMQAKIIKDNNDLTYLKLLFYFIKSRTCRIHLFVRLRSSNKLLSYIAKKYLDKYFIEIGKHVHVVQYVTIGDSFKKFKMEQFKNYLL
ncbi:MAG: hypothetical protein CL624_04890 [Arcobacter sp.]|nr:hypothetical protein [Arcobacter sp.]|tara:strand:+ start:2847 stop:3146 length:300 start_codon:yes stop_codon:yes gene_type:complete